MEIWIILEKFHILGAVGIESGEGQKPVGEGGRVGWGAIGEIQLLPPKGHAKTHIFNNKHWGPNYEQARAISLNQTWHIAMILRNQSNI